MTNAFGTQAYFVARNPDPKREHMVVFYQARDSTYVVEVKDMPSLTQRSPNAERMVRAFADLREMTSKDYGATAVSWGTYSHYSRYWPEYATPDDEEI